jgi:hypothetical protein
LRIGLLLLEISEKLNQTRDPENKLHYRMLKKQESTPVTATLHPFAI